MERRLSSRRGGWGWRGAVSRWRYADLEVGAPKPVPRFLLGGWLAHLRLAFGDFYTAG